MTFKSELYFKRLGTQNDNNTEGKVFVKFISLVTKNIFFQLNKG
jgi:hypothetical protein